MLAAAVIVFREVLEAALIVSVILAATKGVKNRLAMVFGGVAVGILGSCFVALFTNELSGMFAGNGQELFHAGVMFTVVALLTWHIVWMQQHGRELVCEMKSVGAAVVAGTKPLVVLATVVALAVLREGSEVVLFVQGMLASGAVADVMMGFALGMAAGVLVGALLYWGFVRLSVSHLFASTNIVLMLIAAGMAARGAEKLVAAGFIPPLQEHVWDTSAVLPETSLPGQFLSALIGYIAQPSGVQILFYAATVTGISLLLWLQRKTQPVRIPRS